MRVVIDYRVCSNHSNAMPRSQDKTSINDGPSTKMLWHPRFVINWLQWNLPWNASITSLSATIYTACHFVDGYATLGSWTNIWLWSFRCKDISSTKMADLGNQDNHPLGIRACLSLQVTCCKCFWLHHWQSKKCMPWRHYPTHSECNGHLSPCQ